MENREIKELFLQADKQIAIQESRKQQVLTSMTRELKQQKIPVLNQREILFSHFLYMDKSFLILYAIAVCFCIGILLLLQRTGADINTMIIACMIGVSGIAVLTVFLIDKLFFGRMAELGASCYFSTKQSVAVYMVIVGSVNLAIFILIILCIGSSLNIGVLQLGLYMMTAFFLSNIVSMGILSTEIGRENRYFLFINSVFLAIGYTVFSAVPTAFSAVSLGAWGIACFILGSLFALQLKKFFAEMIKGEILCMN